VAGLLACSVAAGCAQRAGVPIESRPTPPQPGPVSGAPAPPAGSAPAPGSPAAVPTLRQRIAADTLAARRALRRCAGRRLLVEQEMTFESITRLLIEARSALGAGRLDRAAVVAREARTLSSSLGCP
jgi:hypothetical protein